jgi:REP element-mobilizing transposase RayT
MQAGAYYHVYNRGNNGEVLFGQARNYDYFLQLYTRHIYGIADTYAYCLIPNHFHFLVRIKRLDEIPRELGVKVPTERDIPRRASQAFSNLFNAYARAFNRASGRTGSLFARPFKRRLVVGSQALGQLLAYIHLNPVKHGFVDDHRAWRYSSYGAFLSPRGTRLRREDALGWFPDRQAFLDVHEADLDWPGLRALTEEDMI